MIEVYGDLWSYLDVGWLCITTNGTIKNNGRCVMGKGCAREAKDKLWDIDLKLGELIESNGNVVNLLDRFHSGYTEPVMVFSFPVKHNWWEIADLELIRRSCQQLREIWLDSGHGLLVVIPQPGCGNGGRLWEWEVKPIMEEELPEDEFRVITWDRGRA